MGFGTPFWGRGLLNNRVCASQPTCLALGMSAVACWGLMRKVVSQLACFWHSLQVSQPAQLTLSLIMPNWQISVQSPPSFLLKKWSWTDPTHNPLLRLIIKHAEGEKAVYFFFTRKCTLNDLLSRAVFVMHSNHAVQLQYNIEHILVRNRSASFFFFCFSSSLQSI